MQQVNASLRLLSLGLAAFLTVAAAFSTRALFTAPELGASLRPVGGAEKLIDLIQGQETILWSSLNGTVSSLEVLGWPSSDGEHELGGALMIEAPDDGTVGIIDTGERPMLVEFTLSG